MNQASPDSECRLCFFSKETYIVSNLVCFVKNNRLMVDQAEKTWSGMDIALRTAMSEIKQPSSGYLPTSLGLRSGSEAVVCNVP